ncbi:MAG: glycosyltransferase [Endomicrobium sp.]|jgi:glycosyltransferase involved in cell wall biosynthesis|nr:glycosyltransferase [Endomicrobium sp.]
MLIKSSKLPLISIVLPTYNGERYIRQSIKSIIRQTEKFWELIVVDDCSTDTTANIAKEYEGKDQRIKVITNEKNEKLPRALNIGFRKALGRFFTWTSDDNLYKPEALSIMSEYLLRNLDTDLVFCSSDIVDENLALIRDENVSGIRALDLVNYNKIGACFMYRREIANSIGEYDDNMFCAEDYDYWCRIAIAGKIRSLPYNLYVYRSHANSLTETAGKEAVEKMKIVRNKYVVPLMLKYYNSISLKIGLLFSFLILHKKIREKFVAKICRTLARASFWERLFSVCDKRQHKLVRIFGVKIKFKLSR